jgi:anti-anti-sigma factor
MPEGFTIDSRESPGAIHIAPQGELDLATVPELDAAIAAAQARPGLRVLVDLRGVTFLDATALRCLIRAKDRANAAGSVLEIVRGPGHVQHTVEVVGLAEELPFVDRPTGEPG